MKNTGKSLYILLAAILVFSFGTIAFAADVEKVVVGTEGAYAPYNFVDEKGNVDGLDIAVLREADKLIPELEFTFEPTEWTSIFVAMESGKFHIIASNINYNEERDKKYLFSAKPYYYSPNSIIFKDGRADIKSIADLHGKTVTAGLGSANTTWLENYNAKNGNPIKISYSDGDVSKMLQEIVNDRADATLNSLVAINKVANEQGIKVGSVVWADVDLQPVYFLFARTEKGERYKVLIDKALDTLIENGTLGQLSKTYLGADYSTEAAVLSQSK
jgi:ABC-type amino acid transport substrate-binding protein